MKSVGYKVKKVLRRNKFMRALFSHISYDKLKRKNQYKFNCHSYTKEQKKQTEERSNFRKYII